MAAMIFIIGSVVVYDSYQIGSGWAEDGPQAGYFPFYIGLIICIASVWIFFQTAFGKLAGGGVFVSLRKLRLVLAVLFPAIGFVIATYFIGLYVSAAVFIAAFMRWQGKFSIMRILPVSLVVPVLLFLMFEVWFLVPLPKGPVEALVGY
ncbi:MAG: tripartite tricarboxylate transporter TctB family protein [Pseudomonadota bacterium]|nr:MAG: tripartite tricarboxylate transporter TctB family protein [Pseudomonadota bacterium]